MSSLQSKLDLLAQRAEDAGDATALLGAAAETLRVLRAVQIEDRAARKRAEAALAALAKQHELLTERSEAQQKACVDRCQADLDKLEAERCELAARLEDLERELAAKNRRFEELASMHRSLAGRQESQAGIYLAEIERLRELLAVPTGRAPAHGTGPSRALREHSRYTRHPGHALVDAVLSVAGPVRLQELIVDAPLFTRTNFQPTFVPNPEGVYQLTEFLALHDRGFVRAAYLAILRREPDPSGAQNYLNLVRSGENKARLLHEFMVSPEGRRHHTVIHGLAESLRVLRLCELPLVGRAISAMLFLFNVGGHLRDFRVLENHVIRIAEESQAIHEANMSKLRSLSK